MDKWPRGGAPSRAIWTDGCLPDGLVGSIGRRAKDIWDKGRSPVRPKADGPYGRMPGWPIDRTAYWPEGRRTNRAKGRRPGRGEAPIAHWAKGLIGQYAYWANSPEDRWAKGLIGHIGPWGEAPGEGRLHNRPNGPDVRWAHRPNGRRGIRPFGANTPSARARWTIGVGPKGR